MYGEDEHEAIVREAISVTPAALVRSLARAAFAAGEFAQLVLLDRGAVEEFAAERREGSVVMKRRVLLVSSVLEDLQEYLVARDVLEARFERKASQLVDDAVLRASGSREKGLDLLRSDVWRILVTDYGEARLVDESVRLKLSGEGAPGNC